MGTEVRLDFSTVDAIRSLDDLESRLDTLARKAEAIHIGGSSSGSGGAMPPDSGGGDTPPIIVAALSRIVSLLESIDSKGGGSGGGGGGGGGGRGRTPEDEAARNRTKAEQEAERTSALLRSQVGATIGGAGQVMSGNVLGGLGNMAGVALGAMFGPLGGAIGAAINTVLSVATMGLDKIEEGAVKNARRMMEEQGTTSATIDPKTYFDGANEFINRTGLGLDDYASLRRRNQRSSGLLTPIGDMSDIAGLERIGIDAGQSGRYMGIGQQFGGAAETTQGVSTLAGLSQNLGLAANAIFDLVAPMREQIIKSGGADIGQKTTDFLQRLYASPDARATGLGAATAVTGLTSGNVGLSQRMLAPAAEMANVMDEIAAYQAGSAAGGGMFGFMGGSADFALGDTGEAKAQRYRGRFGTDGATAMIRGRTSTSDAAARAVAIGAGVDTGARAASNALGISPGDMQNAFYNALRQNSIEESKKASQVEAGEGVGWQAVKGFFERAVMNAVRAVD